MSTNQFRDLVQGFALAFAVLGVSSSAHAGFRHRFEGGLDGSLPMAGLIMDKSGNYYGTTQEGGAYPYGWGTVFKITPDGTETVLYSFGSQAGDGLYPEAGLITDKKGNLYGTTEAGGNTTGCNGWCGTIFKLANDGTETVLYKFLGGSDGANPTAGLIRDSSGNFYGTTANGGGSGCSGGFGCGAVFRLAKDGSETVLYSFTGGSDGATPIAGLILDATGNLYGTTAFGGNTNCSGYGCGVIFKLATDGTETVLYSFSGGSDGAEPYASLIMDGAGNLYGTTIEGGEYGYGTAFELTPSDNKIVLHSFGNGSDGASPAAGLIEDGNGNLFGTTYAGGGSSHCENGCGTVFELAPNGTETLLRSFGIGRESPLKQGASPMAGVIMDKKGNLYGTTKNGGNMDGCFHYGCGTAFKLKR